ncbi:MAG: anaerobic sulfatase maturase [Candidatus Hydrogenedentes bacterium]|nr:anaerobic sulfatase maturase [Candidatus Hydrogenedentota bacterium]
MMHSSAYANRPFHVMVKPVGSSCNLRCSYCFYLEKKKLYPHRREPKISDSLLESFIEQHCAAQARQSEIHFAWQGGEPTLAGLPFFKKVIALQQRYAQGKAVKNALQTNGILFDNEWADFLKEQDFLVGLSLDGPERFHDRYRRDPSDGPTFQRVMESLRLLKEHDVAFNILACVNRQTAQAPEDVYRFLRAHGSGFIQFIPIVERRVVQASEDALTLVAPDDPVEAAVTEWSVRPRDYGLFLQRIFDLWVREDVGRVFIQLFDTALEAWLGYEPSLCFFKECCGDALILEYNGDLYSCDHFVYPSHLLGNLNDLSLIELARSAQQQRFGEDKRDRLPQQCRACPVNFVCHGECPKHRFLRTADGEKGLNYLCEAYRHFFAYINSYMRFMAQELQQNRAPANIMEQLRRAETTKKEQLEPNAPCPCGSGKKYKKCCGTKSKS